MENNKHEDKEIQDIIEEITATAKDLVEEYVLITLQYHITPITLFECRRVINTMTRYFGFYLPQLTLKFKFLNH